MCNVMQILSDQADVNYDLDASPSLDLVVASCDIFVSDAQRLG
jgi:hypothetical protein